MPRVAEVAAVYDAPWRAEGLAAALADARSDGGRYARYRAVLNPAFTPGKIRGMTDRTRAVAVASSAS